MESHPSRRYPADGVLITVAPGARAAVGSFNVKNQTPYPDADLIRRSEVKPNKPFTSARSRVRPRILKKYLVNQGYLGAGILSLRVPTTRRPTCSSHYSVTTGPKFSVNLSGARTQYRQTPPTLADLCRRRRRPGLCCRKAGATFAIIFSARDISMRTFRSVRMTTPHRPCASSAYELGRGENSVSRAIGFRRKQIFRQGFARGPLWCCSPPRSLPAAASASRWCAMTAIRFAALYLSNGFLRR